MSTQNEVSAGEDVIVDIPDFTPTLDKDGKDITDWKARAEEAIELAKKNKGIATRFKTKLDKSKDKPADNPAPQNQPQASDLGELAFLNVNGVKTPEQVEFFNKMKKETGKTPAELFQSTYFQVEFKAFNEKSATKNATPSGNNRSANPAIDSVDYWIAKGEMPTGPENKKLREDIVNEKMKREQSTGQFYNS